MQLTENEATKWQKSSVDCVIPLIGLRKTQFSGVIIELTLAARGLLWMPIVEDSSRELPKLLSVFHLRFSKNIIFLLCSTFLFLTNLRLQLTQANWNWKTFSRSFIAVDVEFFWRQLKFSQSTDDERTRQCTSSNGNRACRKLLSSKQLRTRTKSSKLDFWMQSHYG